MRERGREREGEEAGGWGGWRLEAGRGEISTFHFHFHFFF